ncbi:hypothetical protein AB0O28_15710 [Microbispora sp. NPDC088329]|uniref:hypothetical protein n=1 Tax=Microbispora sp. NPDC088329 TaxID=3154869 RepID=UPI0034242735
MGRTASPRVAVAVVSTCAALTCVMPAAAFSAPVRPERPAIAGARTAALVRQGAATAGDTAGDTAASKRPEAGGMVRATGKAAVKVGDPDGPGLRVGVCVDVNVIVGLHAEVGIGGPACTPPTPVPPPAPPPEPQPAPSPKPPPSPEPPPPPRVPERPAPRHSPHRVAAAPRPPAAMPSPRPRATPRPTPSPSKPAVHRVPAMRAIAPVRHRNPLGALTVIVVLSVAIAAAGAAAFRR